MSAMGVTPGGQGGLPGAGKIWPIKRLISQQVTENNNRKEKFISFF